MQGKTMKAKLKRLLPPPREDEIQKQIVQGLSALGFLVLVTSRRVKRCRHCGNWQSGKDGAARGIPDLLVSRQGWRQWVGAEIKSATGRLRPEQQELHERGLTLVWRSWEDALAWARVAVEGNS